MPHTNGIITKSINFEYDIARTIGVGSGDLGTLCRSNSNNPMAMYKPIRHTAIGQVTDAQRHASNSNMWGLKIPEFSDPANLISSSTSYTWQYLKPTGGNYKYRSFDYISETSPTVHGYFHNAPSNILCCLKRATDTVEINPVNENVPSTIIPFYALSKNSTDNGIYDKKIDTTLGISGESYEHTSVQLECSLGIEDLLTNGGNSLYGTNCRLGVALFTGSTASTYQEFVPCVKDLVNNKAQRDLEMVEISEATLLALPVGSYTAVGCMRFGTPLVPIGETPSFTYIPLHAYGWNGTDGKRNSFTLNIGGVNNYEISVLGLSNSASGTPASSINNTTGAAYLHVSVKNISTVTHGTTTVTFDRWVDVCTVTGSYVDSNGNTVAVNRTLRDSS